MKKLKTWALENKLNLIKLIICFVGLIITCRYVNYLALKAESQEEKEESILNTLTQADNYSFKCIDGDVEFTGEYVENIITLHYKENNYYISDGIDYVVPEEVYGLIERSKFVTTVNEATYQGDYYSISNEKYNHYFDKEIKKEDAYISLIYDDNNVKIVIDDLSCTYVK